MIVSRHPILFAPHVICLFSNNLCSESSRCFFTKHVPIVMNVGLHLMDDVLRRMDGYIVENTTASKFFYFYSY